MQLCTAFCKGVPVNNSRYGIIFLLFMVGLESSLSEFKRTGRESFQVAVLGVVAPIVLGLMVMYGITPGSDFNSNLFIAATLCATSVGITARVLKELKKTQTREAKTILGAAMVDDILGLMILAIVSSIVTVGVLRWTPLLSIIASAVLFFVLVILLGPYLIKGAVRLLYFLNNWEAKLFISFSFAMLLAWLTSFLQLSTIIGAFAAGVILNDDYFQSVKATKNLSIRELMVPFEAILAPLFFVLIGIQVKLETFFDWHVLIIAVGLTVAAILGKLISGLGAHKKDDKWLIGIGMMPRGEVGLVFASVGITLHVISDQLFSAIVLVVILTTLCVPPWLKHRYNTRLSEP